jgi:Flp pilus assembly protein TadG
VWQPFIHQKGIGMKRKFIRDQTGEGYIDVAITMLILFTLMASLMALFPIFTTQQSLNQTAKYVARTVELYGKADEDTLASVTENENFMAPDSVEIDTEWHDAAAKTIQLKTPFTVTITKNMSIVILRPALGEPLTIDVEITSSARGISEVFFK